MFIKKTQKAYDATLFLFKKAIEEKNSEKIGEIISYFFYKLNLTYAEVYKLANEATGINEADWEDLVREWDDDLNK